MRSLDSFNSATEPLDPVEIIGITVFRINLLEWRRFRHVIFVGNDSSKLMPKSVPTVPKELAIEYQSLAKSHYQSVSHLVCARQCLQSICKGHTAEPETFLTYFRAQSEFYFHLGVCLDGIARLAFLLCTHGQEKRRETHDWWDYAKLRKWDTQRNQYAFNPEFKAVGDLVQRYRIEEIYLMRN